MQPTGFFDAAEKPTIQATKGHRAATVLSYNLKGEESGLVASFFCIVHQALILQQTDPESLFSALDEPLNTQGNWWASSLKVAVKKSIGEIYIDNTISSLFSTADEQRTLTALLGSLPPLLYKRLFEPPSKCFSCDSDSSYQPLLLLSYGVTIHSLLEKLNTCSACGRHRAPDTPGSLLHGLLFPQKYFLSIPMKLDISSYFFLVALITETEGYYLCIFVNPHILSGQASNVIKDRYFLLYAPPNAPLRTKQGSRAAEFTYLKHKKVLRYLGAPASSPETAILGKPVCAFYCNVDSLKVDMQSWLKELASDGTQTLSVAKASQPLFSEEKGPEAAEPLSIVSIPVISMQDKHSFSTLNEETSEGSSRTEPPVMALPSVKMFPVVADNKPLFRDNTTPQKYCIDCREHCAIYSFLIALLLATIILFILVICFYLKFENMVVTNLLVTRRAFLGFSDWNATDIPRDQLVINTSDPNATAQNYSLVVGNAHLNWVLADKLLGNNEFPVNSVSSLTVQVLNITNCTPINLNVKNLLFNNSFTPGVNALNRPLRIDNFTVQNATVTKIETPNSIINISNDIRSMGTIAGINTLKAERVLGPNVLDIIAPNGSYHILNIPASNPLQISNITLNFIPSTTIQGLTTINGQFYFPKKVVVTNTTLINPQVNNLRLGKLDVKSTINVRSLEAGDGASKVILNSDGVKHSTDSFNISVPAPSITVPHTMIRGNLGRGTVNSLMLNSSSCTCGAALGLIEEDQ